MLRLSEVYTSTQGEGPNTGRMTQFVRFAGCNMRCPGWPCDTQFAIDPKLYLHDGTTDQLTSMGVFKRVAEWPKRICLTGGEPFLQKTDELRDLCMLLIQANYKLEVFTNGSFYFPSWLAMGCSVMMDWKLTGSGEQDTKRDVRMQNALSLRPGDGIKFVVTNIDDLVEAHDVYIDLMHRSEHQPHPEFWVGAAWGKITDQEIIDFVQDYKLPFRLNVQIHKHIWNPELRGV